MNLRYLLYHNLVSFPRLLALFRVDRSVRLRYHHFGEDDYGDIERVILQRLMENGATGLSGRTVDTSGQGVEAAPSASVQSPETYLGYRKAERFALPERLARDSPKTIDLTTRSKRRMHA
jgi:hypothetical protein